MDVKVINKLNKVGCSITTLKFDNEEIPLNEKDLYNLVYQLNIMRNDIIKEVLEIDEYEDEKDSELEDLKNTISDLERDLDDANDRIEELENTLNEEGIEY